MQKSERTLDAPDLVDDFYLNLLDWGSSNVISIALGSTVYLWDASDGSTSELVTVDEECGPVTSVKWAPDGKHIALGLNNSDVQLWDSTVNRRVSVFYICCRCYFSSSFSFMDVFLTFRSLKLIHTRSLLKEYLRSKCTNNYYYTAA